MFKWLRTQLGFEYIRNECDYLAAKLGGIRSSLDDLEQRIAIHNQALGRLIAKLDPIYGVSEDDPQRRKESDEISNQVIKKLYAEHMARKHQEGQ